MSILTQNLPASYPHIFDSDLLSQLISPFASSYSVFDYGPVSYTHLDVYKRQI